MGTDALSSAEQVKCLNQWATKSSQSGAVIRIGGDTLEVCICVRIVAIHEVILSKPHGGSEGAEMEFLDSAELYIIQMHIQLVLNMHGQNHRLQLLQTH